MKMAYEAFADDDPRRRRQHWSRGKEVVRDGEAVHVSLYLTDGPPPPERRFVVDTNGRQTALLTDEERKMRDDALDARDADLRDAWKDAGSVNRQILSAQDGPKAEGENAPLALARARVERDVDLQNAWRGPAFTPMQRDLAIKEALARYGLARGDV
jgi:hypothetical protein